MDRINTSLFNTSFGELILGSYQGQLCLCDWVDRKKRSAIDARIQKGLNAKYCKKDDKVLENTRKQLDEYLSGNRQQFDVPLLTVGTPFQKSVWETLLTVGYGQTISYLGLAKKMRNEKAIRAIASANGANAISILIPCHRIIGSNGKLVGYAGGLPAKQKLLQFEASNEFQAIK